MSRIPNKDGNSFFSAVVLNNDIMVMLILLPQKFVGQANSILVAGYYIITKNGIGEKETKSSYKPNLLSPLYFV